jgi:hypothetical protein
MRIFGAGAILAITTCSLATASPADACALAYPADSFVRLSGEETLIVWDAAHKTEHFVRTPIFEGDPKSFGFFVPTPVTPVVEKVDAEIFHRVAELVVPPQPKAALAGGAPGAVAAAAAPPPVEVTQRVKIDEFELVSLKASDASSLGQWLAKNGFVDKPALEAWWQPYVAQGFIVNAMRYAGPKDKEHRPLAAPTLRFSFSIEKPFYPYTEPETDAADERAHAERTGRCKKGAADCVPDRDRKLDLYVVSHGPMRATIDDAPAAENGGPIIGRVGQTESRFLANALGDTKKWGFDPLAQTRWTITHFVDTAGTRRAQADVVFVPIGTEIPFPAAASTPKPAPQRELGSPPKKNARAKGALFAGVALLLAIAVGFALRAANES